MPGLPIRIAGKAAAFCTGNTVAAESTGFSQIWVLLEDNLTRWMFQPCAELRAFLLCPHLCPAFALSRTDLATGCC